MKKKGKRKRIYTSKKDAYQPLSIKRKKEIVEETRRRKRPEEDSNEPKNSKSGDFENMKW